MVKNKKWPKTTWVVGGGPHSPPSRYTPSAKYTKMIKERDVMIPMRDGIRIAVDIYRPDAHGKFPTLIAYAPHNKDLQGPDAWENFGPQPAWSSLWLGAQEAGDTKFIVSRGYAHVIANPRGIGKSEGAPSGRFGVETDLYDIIEWIANQPWCNGNIGMIGISAFACAQWIAAKQQPPHLKAIFPYDPGGAYWFRDLYPGGVLHVIFYLLDQLDVTHIIRDRPEALPSELERLWKIAISNPDYKMYPHIFNVLTQKGQHTPEFFHLLLNPFDNEKNVEKIEEDFNRIKVPFYTGSGWYAYTYKLHLEGAQHWFTGVKGVPKKLIFTGPAHLERPFHELHAEIIRWYDYWLKGIDTGIMNDPPVKIWVMGANKWLYAEDWPLPETVWTKFYLRSWERLCTDPPTSLSIEDQEEPDAFVQMPPTQTRKIQRLRYMTDPLPEDMLVIGPSVLCLYASIDQEDTNWIIILKDVGPDVSVQTAREGEKFVPANLPERELTRGWLKASHKAIDPKRSKPWKPWHPLTREAWKPVKPGEINEYAIEILATANLFKAGHRICLDITALDLPTGVAGFTNVEYVPYHICSSKTTLHKIYHDPKYPSHLLLPIIPEPKNIGKTHVYWRFK